MENNSTQQLAPAVTNAVKLIELLASESQALGISEISRKLDLNKNMVYRILNTLQKKNWVYLDEQNGKYQLTLQPFQTTSKSLQRLTLNNAALPSVYSLWQKTGESTYLAVLRENAVVYIQHLDSVKSVKVSGAVGGSYPLYCSAPGKVLLAYAGDEAIDRYCKLPFRKMTEHTITDPYEFKAYLARVRENGYATDIEEFGYGIVCYAAPIFDHTGAVVGSVGCSGSLVTCDRDTFVSVYGRRISETANQISTLLGGREIYPTEGHF